MLKDVSEARLKAGKVNDQEGRSDGKDHQADQRNGQYLEPDGCQRADGPSRRPRADGRGDPGERQRPVVFDSGRDPQGRSRQDASFPGARFHEPDREVEDHGHRKRERYVDGGEVAVAHVQESECEE